ncbi:hypothetical protein CMV_007429 [Castanea mollissima]|uniref:Uncharacterized protein n=1 Tax=Castanea mollissima TaxID=60419 RepID=A0A8J4RLV7_9ROSI|nr:hypothetical protein CMV_007429 [Castanea mollissima]
MFDENLNPKKKIKEFVRERKFCETVVESAREVERRVAKWQIQQLHLEERLLRTSSHNWCIVNDGTNQPTIVMGVSGFRL